MRLVREYLACVDELTTIKLIMQKKVEHFRALFLDAEKFETEDSQAGLEPNRIDGETSPARVTWALKMVKAQHDSIDRLLLDLKQSMNAVRFPPLLFTPHLCRLAYKSPALPTSIHRTE